MHFDHILPALGDHEVDHPGPPFDQQVAPGRVGNHEGRFEFRIDPPRGTVDHHPLPLLGLEPVMVGRPRRNHGIADRIELQLLGRRNAGVPRRLRHLRQPPHREHPPRRQPQPGHHMRLVQPRLALGRDRHGVLVRHRLPIGVELLLGGHLRRTEDQLLRPVEMVPREGDVDLGPLRPPHREGRQQARGRQPDRLGEHRRRPQQTPERQHSHPETGPGSTTLQTPGGRQVGHGVVRTRTGGEMRHSQRSPPASG